MLQFIFTRFRFDKHISVMDKRWRFPSVKGIQSNGTFFAIFFSRKEQREKCVSFSISALENRWCTGKWESVCWICSRVKKGTRYNNIKIRFDTNLISSYTISAEKKRLTTIYQIKANSGDFSYLSLWKKNIVSPFKKKNWITTAENRINQMTLPVARILSSTFVRGPFHAFVSVQSWLSQLIPLNVYKVNNQ